MLALFRDIYRFLFLDPDYTTYVVTRKPGLPVGYSMQDMSDDYARMITDEFGGPVDVLGVSTGGSIALYFAADHPELVRKLILHSSAYALSDSGRDGEIHIGNLARQRQWRQAYASFVSPMFPKRGFLRLISGPVIWLVSLLGGPVFGAPEDPSDLLVTIKAEENLNFKDRLSQISAPTLVVAGEKDPFYTEILFRETAEGIPNSKLIIYKGMGHPAAGKEFHRDVSRFLKEVLI